MANPDEDGIEGSFGEPIQVDEADIAEKAPPTNDQSKDEGKPPVDDEGDDEDPGDTDVNDEDKGKRRSKPAHVRIAEITAKLRQAERERDAAIEQREAPKPEAAKPADLEEPNPDEFEFGEADPAYLKALARYEVKAELAEEARKANETRQAEAQREQAANLDRSWEEKAAKGSEKYADFNEVVVEGAANGDWSAPPLVAVAISASDVGADVAYHLASNPAESRALAAQAQVNPVAAAEEFGKIEGRFLESEPQLPNGPNINQLDYARYAGQMRGYLTREQTSPTPKTPIVTKAPTPPRDQARGAGGQFETRDDTDDLDAFSSKFFAKK